MIPSFEMTDAEQRLANAITIGVVVEADYAAARAKVQIGDLPTGWLAMATARAGGDRTWAAYEVGEQVVVVSEAGDFANGVIIAALNSTQNPAPADAATVTRTTFADGAVIEYDRAAHRLRASLPAGGEVDIDAPGGVTINGDVVVTGDVIADGVSLKHHTHGGVQPGGGSTGEPNA